MYALAPGGGVLLRLFFFAAFRASAMAIPNCSIVRIFGTRNLPTMKDGVPLKPNAVA